MLRMTPHDAAGRGPARRNVLFAVALLAAAAGLLGWRASLRPIELGAALYEGRAPLSARIDGHAVPMPADVVACANCHAPQSGAATAASRAAANAGPVLSGDLLIQARPRRGGPPSHYDLAAFCRLLRTGEDPAGVLLPRAMPRYDVDATACDALWRFVTAR